MTFTEGPSAALTNGPAGYQAEQVSTQMCSVYGCSFWSNSVSFWVQYNGSYVYLDGAQPTCTPSNSVFYGQSIDWCGIWNNGGQNGYGYMNGGDNFRVFYNVVTCNYWQRINVRTNGTSWVTNGSSTGC
ncbi:MAG: hypothetical protein ACRDFS_12760 [Chloroflexota bacterium]